MGISAVVFKNPKRVKAEFGVDFEIDELTGEAYLRDWEREQSLGLPPFYSKALRRRLGNTAMLAHIKSELGDTGMCADTKWLCRIVNRQIFCGETVPASAVPVLRDEIMFLLDGRLRNSDTSVAEYVQSLLEICNAALEEQNPIVFF